MRERVLESRLTNARRRVLTREGRHHMWREFKLLPGVLPRLRLLRHLLYDSELCHRCGQTYPEVWWCDDQPLWNEVVGGPGGLRCPRCFEREARERGVTLARHASRLDAPPEDRPMLAPTAEQKAAYLRQFEGPTVDPADAPPEN